MNVNIALSLCILVLLLEARGLSISLPKRKWMAFIFYTQLSNLMTTISSLLLLISMTRPSGFVILLRYVSVCMMIMTFAVTVCVLIPMGGNPRTLLWSGNGIYHHVLCPVLTTISYLFFEYHVGFWAILCPVILTLVYGLIMIYLNAKEKVDGPYPFFRVHHQSVLSTVLWMVVLMIVVSLISTAVCMIAR